jgi:lysophospholipase L1-like esterase
MKAILCFGDSLTWGFEAGTWHRHPFEARWPNALAAGLKGRARCIEEGLNGRTTVYPDPTDSTDLSGASSLPVLLKSHQPLDLVIMMLGTNDLKRARAFDAALGMHRLIVMIQRFEYMPGYAAPKILIVSPPPLCETSDPFFRDLWGHAIAESRHLARYYAEVAAEDGVQFFDGGTVARTDPRDGGHLDCENTRGLGAALVPVVERILDL